MYIIVYSYIYIYVIVYFCVTLYIIGYGRLTPWMTRYNYCKLKQTTQQELLIIVAASTCTAPCLVQMLYVSIHTVNIIIHQMYGKTCANLALLLIVISELWLACKYPTDYVWLVNLMYLIVSFLLQIRKSGLFDALKKRVKD